MNRRSWVPQAFWTVTDTDVPANDRTTNYEEIMKTETKHIAQADLLEAEGGRIQRRIRNWVRRPERTKRWK
jgi:hypothetical protein